MEEGEVQEKTVATVTNELEKVGRGSHEGHEEPDCVFSEKKKIC